MSLGRKDGYSRINVNTVKEAFRIFARFNNYLNRHWKSETAMLIAGSASMFFSLATPYLGKIVLDNGILARNMTLFLKFTIISGAVYALRQISDKGSAWLKDNVTRKIKIKLTRDVFRKIRRLSIVSFQDTSVGECVSRINADVSASAGIIASTLPDIIQSVLRLILITAIIFMINGKLLLIIAAYQAVVMAQIFFLTKKNEALARAAHSNSWEMSRVLTQFFSQIYFVKISGNMLTMVRKYFNVFADAVRLDLKSARLRLFSGILSELSGKLFFGIIGFIGTLLVIRGELTLGSLGAVIAYISQGSGACTSLFGLLQRVVLNRVSLERVADLLDEPIHVKEKDGAGSVEFLEGRIEFRDVCFGYESERHILKNMNFVISPGANIALVGYSGRGKTTIANLILRLYDVNNGSIFLENHDIRDIRFRSIYGQIGLAPQSSFIWSGSIREIITCGSSKITEAAMVEAARLAEIHSFIDGLPGGYDTMLSDMVSKISQGQRQRIAIARAIAKRPKIFIMDEASSSLDSNTEEKIIDNIRRRSPGLTFIMISHRLSAVKKMDTVYFLKAPDAMVIGEHVRLMEEEPAYRELFLIRDSSS